MRETAEKKTDEIRMLNETSGRFNASTACNVVCPDPQGTADRARLRALRALLSFGVFPGDRLLVGQKRLGAVATVFGR